MAWKFFTAQGSEKRIPATVNNPAASVVRNTTQSISNAASTAISWDTVLYDTNSFYAGGNPTRLTVNQAGKYRVTANVCFTSNVTGVREAWFLKNGTGTSFGAAQLSAANGDDTTFTISAEVNLAAGDYVEVYVFQSSGGALNFRSVNNGFQISKVDGVVVSYVGVPGSLVGQELAYAEVTGTTNIVGTTTSTATQIVAAPSITVDGNTKIRVEGFFPVTVLNSVNGGFVVMSLYEGGSTDLGWLAQVVSPSAAAAGQQTLYGIREFTPSAGSHTYSINAWTSSTTGTPQVQAGAGGAGTRMPGFIRITRAA